MAPHSSTLGKSHGWRSLVGCGPWGRYESDMTEQLHFHFSLFTFMHWRRKWQPTPVFLPGESQGWWSLMGCRLWGCTDSDTTEATWQQRQQTAALQASLSFSISQSCLKLMSMESVMPSILILRCSFSSCPQSFPELGSFSMSWLFASDGQSIGASASVLPMNIQG